MRRSSLAVLCLITLAATAAAVESQETPVAPLRLPAPLYDVDAAWDLGWGDAPGLRPTSGAAGMNTANGSVAATVNRAPGQRTSTPAPSAPSRSQFLIRVDSILYRRGSEWVDIAVADIQSVTEVHRPQANPRGWVRVTYAVAGGVREVYFRQANATSQATFIATINRAIELNREALSASR